MRLLLTGALCFFLLVPVATGAGTWHVRQDGTGDCATIQACVDLAGNGDTVLVGQGVYYETVFISSKTDFVLKAEGEISQTVMKSGPAIVCRDVLGHSVIEGLNFDQCSSWTYAGGAIFAATSSLTIRGNIFFKCVMYGLEGTGGWGGAMYLVSSTGNIVGNTIYACASESGGGIGLCESPSIVVDRNIIAGCSGGGIYSLDCTPVISCNDTWNNTPSNYGGIIPDQTGMNGNISLDPEFCNPAAKNFLLNCTSPCLSAPGCGRMGALPVGCGPTTVDQTTWGRIKALFR